MVFHWCLYNKEFYLQGLLFAMSAWHDRVGDLTLFEALTGGAFDRQNWQHSGEFDQNFSKKSNAPGFARLRGWAVLELTGT